MAPSHYLNQCLNIVNRILGNKLQWNLNRNSYIFIQGIAFENAVCEMASFCLGLNVLSWGARGIGSCAIHYNDVIMSPVASQITNLSIVYSTVYSDADHRKHQSSASLAIVRGIHRGPVNSPHKWPVTRIIFPFDDVIMKEYPSETHFRLTSCEISFVR